MYNSWRVSEDQIGSGSSENKFSEDQIRSRSTVFLNHDSIKLSKKN